MRICKTSLVLLALCVGLTNLAEAKDPFGFFRSRNAAKTVSQPGAAEGDGFVESPQPEIVTANPSGTYTPDGIEEGYAPEPEYDNGAYNGQVWSRWPGVPACCDPWLGYCQEPRCYPCARGQGRYIYYEPPYVHKGQACGGRFITWAHGKQPGCDCGGPPVAYAGGGSCDSCVSVTDANHPTPTPVPAPAQRGAPPTAPQPDSIWNSPSDSQPPRNALPPTTTRTISSRVTR